MPKMPKSAKMLISLKELEWLGNFKINFQKILKILKIHFSKKAKNTRISKNAKIWISFKELEWPRNFEINFKKILNMFFQKTPKIPENSFFFPKY